MKISFLLLTLTLMMSFEASAKCGRKLPHGKVTKADCTMNRVALMMKR